MVYDELQLKRHLWIIASLILLFVFCINLIVIRLLDSAYQTELFYYNIVEIGSHNLLKDCLITLSGNGCKVIIGENGTFIKTEMVCEDDQSVIKMGNRCLCAGTAHFAATEGKRIEIGDDFLCSNAVTIRTGDSHSIYDEAGKRINKGKDVIISEHVWIGNQVIILKGTELGRNVVVGSGSVVRGHFSDNMVITGNPAKIIRKKINWDFRR